jgi:uncharacterized phiE125 gp8 family phage protein
MNLEITTDISTEPVSAAEAREWLAIDTTSQDTMIGKLLKGARLKVERLVGKAFGERTLKYTCTMDNSGLLELPYPPVNSITSVVISSDGETETLASTDYAIDNNILVCSAAIGYTVIVTYKAGATIREDERTLILKQLAWDYNNRGDGAAYSPDVVRESKFMTINNGF